MSPIQWILAVMCSVGPACILVVMHQRKLRREFPLFFNYLLLYGLANLAGLIFYLYQSSIYFYVYWVLGALIIGLEFAVIYEVLANSLKPYSALVDLGKLLFRWAAGFLFLIAIVAAVATAGPISIRCQIALNVLEYCIRVMECGLLLFVMVFESRLGISWRHHSVSIIIGLGSYAAVDSIISFLRTRPTANAGLLDVIAGFSLIAVYGFWSATLLMREPQRKNILDSPSRLIFQRWNEALSSSMFLNRHGQSAMPAVDSFIPGVEKAVDRVLARKMSH